MREAYLIDELSKSLGVSLRKTAKPEFFQLLSDMFMKMDFIGWEERVEIVELQETFNESRYAMDEAGHVWALFLQSCDSHRIPEILSLQHLKLLFMVNIKIDPEGARALASLPELEVLGMEIGENGNEVLRSISKIHSLKSLFIASGEFPVDLSALYQLPLLSSLLVGNGANFTSLLRYPSLKHFATKLQGDNGAYLAGLNQIESLMLEFVEVEGQPLFDFSFLPSMENLQRLYVEKNAVPMSVLQQLTNLKALKTKYPLSSFEPLFKLKQLEELALTDSQLTDLSTLTGFDRLKRLDLQGGQVGDISHLQSQETIEFLNLSGNPIVTVPIQLAMPMLQRLIWKASAKGKLTDGKFLTQCPQLTSVNLSGHSLTDTSFMKSLGNLRYVNLKENHLEDIVGFSELPNLTIVDVEQNSIHKLAPLASCSALSTLNASNNPIKDMTVLSRLRSLQVLKLGHTGISDLSFIKRLRNLFALDVEGNQIHSIEPLLELPNLAQVDLTDNKLTEIPMKILEGRTLGSLKISGNHLEGISPELYSGNGKQTLATLRDYYRGLARGRVKHDQVKLLLVGNGRVGKTSVVSRLLDDKFDPDQPSTHGIQLRQWELSGVAQDKLDGQPLKVDIWDFGGQDIYHATHRLFMKTRALFLLVWDRETESDQYSIDELGQRYENFKIPYWIDYIKALSGSPVIIVQNKVDRLTDKDPAYGLEMLKEYPPPKGVLDYRYISAKRDTQNGLPGLHESITLALQNLESIGYELPAQWVEVRDRLLAMDHRYLDYQRYAELCESVGMNPGEDISLAGFLHQAGVVFYQPDDFGDRLILDQKWAIEAVYSLFDRRGGAYADLKIAGRYRGLTLDLLKRKVWQHFSVDEHQLLLEFMKSCEICFEFSEGVYYVPQLLSEEVPSRIRVRWPEPTEFCMHIVYTFLHRAIIERFLVRTGRLGADTEPEIWRNGIVIHDTHSKTEAMVEAFSAENRIQTYAKGDSPVEMLQMIRREFDELHEDFPATVSFSADGGKNFVELEVLRQHAEAGSARVPSTGGNLTDIMPLNVFLDSSERRLPKGKLKVADINVAQAPLTEKIFISYAWGDPGEKGESREAIVDRLYDTLTARNYNVIRDKKDTEYRMLISDFMRRIGQGKLVVVVISDKYLKSSYCMFELLEIYEHGQFQNRVFPIVLGDTKLYDLADRMQYVLHWQKKTQQIEDLIKEIGPGAFSSDGTYKEYDLYYRRISHNIDKLTSLLTNLNTMTPTLLEENNFERLLEVIEQTLTQ